MPSRRPLPLNPPAPIASTPQARALAAKQPSSPPKAFSAVEPEVDLAAQAARAGGFHESSYELQHGLQVSESEWPDDVTVPGALGDR